jgi:hypothetical protein
MTNDRSHRVLPEVSGLVRTSALCGALLSLIAWAAPHVTNSSLQVARIAAELWVAGVLLCSAWAAPPIKARGLLWALPFVAMIVLFFCTDIETRTPALLGAVTICVLMVGGLVGGYIGSLLEHPGMLMVVAYVAALGDIFSVFHPSGLTHKVMANPQALAVLTLSFPVIGTDRVVPLTGIGDVAFAAIFMVGARVTGLSVKRTILALAAAIAVVVLTVELAKTALPAVPFFSAAIVLAHPEVRTLPRGQGRRIALNLALVTLLLGGLWLGSVLRTEESSAPTAQAAGQAPG